MGQKYAVFNELGLPQAFYDDEIHTKEQIPQNAILITEEQWMEFIQNQGRRKWNFETKQVEPFNPEDLISLDEKKQQMLNVLNGVFVSLISQTDYVLIKLQEARELGLDIVSLLQKYQTKLQWRQALRRWKNEKEQAIMNAQNKEELENIDLEDYPRLEK